MALIQKEATTGHVLGMHMLDERGWWIIGGADCVQAALPVIITVGQSGSSRNVDRSARSAGRQADTTVPLSEVEVTTFESGPLAMIAHGAGPDGRGEWMGRRLGQPFSPEDGAYYVMSLENGGSWLDGSRLPRGEWRPLPYGSVVGVGQVYELLFGLLLNVIGFFFQALSENMPR